MNKCLTAEDADRYRSGDLSNLDELQRMDSHLSSCERCRTAVRSGGSPAALARQILPRVGETACLDFDTRARWVDGECDPAEQELVKSHISICRACNEDVAALRDFKETLARQPLTTPRPAARVQWLRGLFAPNAFRLPSLVGAGAAAAIIGGLFVYGYVARPMIQQANQIQDQVAEYRSAQEISRQTLARSQDEMQGLKRQLARSEAEKSTLVQAARLADARKRDLEQRIALLNRPKADHAPLESGPVMALNDAGGKVGLDRRGNLPGLATFQNDGKQAIASALKSGRVTPPRQIAALVGRGGTLMGSGGNASFRLVGPLSTAVAGDRPTLRWQQLPGATGYQVTIVDDLEHSEAATASVPAMSGEIISWTSAAALPRGRVYRWYVVAKRNGEDVQSPSKSDPLARFLVLDNAQASRLQRSIRSAGSSHLALGIAYSAAGMLDDAEHEFQELLRLNPNSKVAKGLFESIHQVRISPRHQ